MRCEVCGRKILGKPYRVIIEGAKLTVCAECAKLGKTTWEEPRPITVPQRLKTQPSPRHPRIITKKPSEAPADTAVELSDGFASKIKQAREKMGLSHEELGKRLNEKVSLLRKIETGKMTPNNTLATKLERTLKIKLLVPASTEKSPSVDILKTASRELTLGDLVKLDKKDKRREESAERKPS